MNEGQRFTLKKDERIAAEKRIEILFEQGQSFLVYPFKIVFYEYKSNVHSCVPMSLLVSIPKKRLKLAVHRNRMKRLVREVYRLNKHIILQEFTKNKLYESRKIDIAFVYVKDNLSDYKIVEKSVRKAFEIVLGKIAEKDQQ